MTAAACFGSDRKVCFEFDEASCAAREDDEEPDEDIELHLTGGDFYAFSRGYYEYKNGEILQGRILMKKFNMKKLGQKYGNFTKGLSVKPRCVRKW